MTISLCIIAGNEEKLLEEFLEYYKPLADEIIIVDTGSTDKTTEIAKKFTKKIFCFNWNDNFSSARNFSISKAAKDWLLWLDPDEKINKKDFEKIKELTKNKDYLGYSFLQKTYTDIEKHPRFEKSQKLEISGELETSKKSIIKGKNNFKGYYIRRICKLFRNHKNIKFEYPIHETVKNSITKGKIKKTDIIIEHFPEKKPKKELIKKEKYYLRLLEKKKQNFPDSNAEKEIKTEEKMLNSLH